MAKTSRDAGNNNQAVARLLRHKATRQYFRDGGWTERPAEARNFYDVVEAAQTCVQHGLADVELAVRVRVEACDLFCTEIR